MTNHQNSNNKLYYVLLGMKYFFRLRVQFARSRAKFNCSNDETESRAINNCTAAPDKCAADDRDPL